MAVHYVAIIIALLVVIVGLLLLVAAIVIQGNKYLIILSNMRHGVYPAYSLQELSNVNKERLIAYNSFMNNGGFDKYNIGTLREIKNNGKNIEDALTEIGRHADLEFAWKKSHEQYNFMLQANIDVMNSQKAIENAYEEEKALFGFMGEWSFIGNRKIELDQKYHEWVKQHFDNCQEVEA